RSPRKGAARRGSGPQGGSSDPWCVVDRAERPGLFQPFADCAVEHWVEFGPVGAYPGTHRRSRFTRAGAALALAARGVDVDTADDFAGAGAEHGVSESAAIAEVLRMAFEVAQVLGQAHLVWPALTGESRCRLDVAEAGRPGRIVRCVVLRYERFQPEFFGR